MVQLQRQNATTLYLLVAAAAAAAVALPPEAAAAAAAAALSQYLWNRRPWRSPLSADTVQSGHRGR